MDATLSACRWGSLSPRGVANTDDSSNTSTPFVSAPSSPRKSTAVPLGFYLSSSPTSPVHIMLELKKSATTGKKKAMPSSCDDRAESRKEDIPTASTAGTNESEEFGSLGTDFDFSARFSEVDGQPWSPAPMSTAEELFYNGQIRPLQPTLLAELIKPPETKPDDGYFDFRSSANYTLRAPQSPRVSPKQEQRKHRFGLPKPAIQATTSALEQWKKASKDARRRSLDDRVRREARAITEGHTTLGTIGTSRRAKERGHRRARSLSPLRVFHMDDQPRQSFESVSSYSSDLQEACKDAMSKASGRMRNKGWRLKELLHVGDSRVHQSTTSKSEKSSERMGKSGSTGSNTAMAAAAPPSIVASSTSSNRNSLRSPKQAVSPHELHYTSQRAQAEQLRRRTFLPYRHGLLGCLGFSSKSYRSVAGIHTLNAKS